MRDDALPIGRIALLAGAIAAGVAVAIAAALGLLAHRRMPFGGEPLARPLRLDAGSPMLQPAPQLDLAAYRAEKSRALNRVGWTDAASGVAHVPVDVAMTLLVQRGVASAQSASAPANPGPGAAR